MDFRWRARWAWLALGGLALALGEGAWASKDNEDADANTLGAAQSSRSDWCARVCGDVGRCPQPVPPLRSARPPATAPPRALHPCARSLSSNLTAPSPAPRHRAQRPSCPRPCQPHLPQTTLPAPVPQRPSARKPLDEVEALKRLMKKEEINSAYVGFHDNYHDGQFFTVLGDPMNNEQKKMWASNQPEGGNKENCALFFQDAKMHDYPCTTRSFFVCQMRH
ncbi:Hemolymph lipopolysaccharide-binding protein [Gryllus bimaculatus]|nr:Hemolymph lipopolysaccharide-binding protein [Gryllus bimaculatus]